MSKVRCRNRALIGGKQRRQSRRFERLQHEGACRGAVHQPGSEKLDRAATLACRRLVRVSMPVDGRVADLAMPGGVPIGPDGEQAEGDHQQRESAREAGAGDRCS